MSENEVLFILMGFGFVVYLLFCTIDQNRRLNRLEGKYDTKERKRNVARMLASGVLKPNEARVMLFNPKCTCEDLTTPAYPEFAAVMFDPNCPFHGDSVEP